MQCRGWTWLACAVALFLALILGACMGTSPLAADEVLTVDSRGKETLRRGQIVDYKGETLTLKLLSDREVQVPTDSIRKLESDWLPDHEVADQQFAERDFPAALISYKAAFKQEPRRWVKRKLLARVVWCQRNMERNAEACKNFARLAADDPDTPYFAAIPLQWQTNEPSAAVELLASKWIREPDAVKQLMAGSWLLTSPLNRRVAIDVLKGLRSHSSEKIATLAISQYWRTELITLRERQIVVWQQRVEEMPSELRAGAYFVLAQAYGRFKQYDRGTLAMLRVPTLYGEDLHLSQLSLLQSAKWMQLAGEAEDAQRLYRQTAALRRGSMAGRQALEALRQ